MKYMIDYKIRHGVGHEQNFNTAEGLITAFSKWKPEDGLNVHAFVSNLVGDAGYVLVETNNPTVILSFVSKFTFWNDVQVHPVIDVAEVIPVTTGSVDWARKASKA
ncbi:DUF3303 domain-containing protein [Bradyrhizobium arachidis]|uniref:DUF3303 domain-containing protein n=1 Tax=Bradyrhizobium TaxID=374 RepID=UPI0021617394|nr:MULTISPECIES: DUF3303 domain-containing protein [Bradyrhizobium]MDN4986475.1 DUF3303 domain-containing protein [Bradyrhizobium sp. WYCCWR 13022]UVO38194.1 DUF3303 domain-containing protein [Bradyrhizobium arachidis]